MNASQASPGGSASVDLLAPLDYLAIEIAAGSEPDAVLAPLRDLVEAGTIGVVDIAFVAVAEDGSVELLDSGAIATRVGRIGDVWAGSMSGLVDRDDAAVVAEAVTPGSIAVVVVYENLWVLGIADTVARSGGRLVADGGVSTDDLLAALDAAEAGLS